MRNLAISGKPKFSGTLWYSENMVIPREPRKGGDSVETIRELLIYQDEEIVHASGNRRKNMNKVAVLEGAAGSPPF